MKTHLAIIALLTTLFSAFSAFAEDKKIVIALIGDSTVTNSAGWGKAFALHFDDRIVVKNFAVGGRSSKSYFDEGRLTPALKSKPDYVLIQFGHNDQPGKGPKRETDPATTYRDFLRMYVNKFRETGAQPILISSVTRRMFDNNDKIVTTLGPWAKAAESVAAEMKVPFINLHQKSISFHNKIGPEASAKFNPKEGDYTHFNSAGAEEIAKLVIQELEITTPALIPYLHKEGQNDPK